MDDVNVKPTSDDKHWMGTAIELSNEQAEKAIVKQKKILQAVNEREQNVLDNYFSAIRIKTEITTSQGGAGGKAKKGKKQAQKTSEHSSPSK